MYAIEPKSSDSSTISTTKATSPIHRLPIALLTKIIEKLPLTQWPALELVDPDFFRPATLLAWRSLRRVDIDRDFIYSEPKAIITDHEEHSSADDSDGEDRDDENPGGESSFENLHRQISRKTESICKKLIEHSPLITTLRVSLLDYDSFLNTTAVRYLSRFEHLETIRFAMYSFPARRIAKNEGDSRTISILGGIDLISLIEFMESTKSRAMLKEISIDGCHISNEDIKAGHLERLHTAFANNDPSRQSLKLESFTPRFSRIYRRRPVMDFLLGAIDPSRMTRLSLDQYSPISSDVLTRLIEGAPRLRHLDFPFMKSCEYGDCRGGRRLRSNVRLLGALESHSNLTSLGFNAIWNDHDCACLRFEAAFLKMLRTIGPRLEKFSFKSEYLPPDIRRDLCAVIRDRMPRLKSIVMILGDDECGLDPMDLGGIADFKQLEEFEFDFSTDFFDSDEIAHDVFAKIVGKSPRLKRFVVENYSPDQRVVMELCKLSNLVELRIRGDTLTEENFVAFARAAFASSLEILYLTEIEEGVESGLIELISKCNRLRKLDVHKNVTDALLTCLADYCPRLECLCVMRSDRITLEGVQILVDRCPNLRRLSVGKNMDCTLQRSLEEDLKFDKYRKPPNFEQHWN